MTGGFQPCGGSSLMGTGGFQPCRRYSDLDDLDFGLKRIKKLFYIHTNPLKISRHFEDRKEKARNGNDFKSDDIHNYATEFNTLLDSNIYPNNQDRFVRLDTLAEKLFSGAKYFQVSHSGVYIFRFVDIPQFSDIDMATLILPSNNLDIRKTESDIYEPFYHDLSLDVVLKTEEENPQKRIGLRVPLLRRDKRLLEEQNGKQGNIFLVTYENIGYEHDRRGEKLEHLQSYSSLHSLERGLVRAIARYSGK